MTKAGDQLLEAASEMLSVARGERPAARIWHNGHAYVPESGCSEAITHLGSVLSMISDLSEGDRCRAFESALCFYNDARPEAKVEGQDGYETFLVHYGPLQRAIGLPNPHDMESELSKMKAYADSEHALANVLNGMNRRLKERNKVLESELAGCKIALEQAWESNRERQATIDRLAGKVDGLQADLDSAIEVAWRRGAYAWVRLNYPEHYERLGREEFSVRDF